MRAAGRFECHYGYLLSGEEFEQLAFSQFAIEYHHAALIGTMRVKEFSAISRPVVAIFETDASFSGVIKPLLWHVDAAGGASTQSAFRVIPERLRMTKVRALS